MTKKEFEKIVKERLKNRGKIIDLDTIEFESVFSNAKLFDTYVLVLSNHIIYKYRAWQNEDITTITTEFKGILGL